MAMNPRLLRPLASGAFNPTQISGLAAWHDASDAATVTLDSGRVASWADKSGNGRTMANATSGSTQPDYITAGQNGRNVVRFTAASTQRLTAAATSTYNFLHNGTPCTVMVAIKAGTTSNPQAALNIMGSNAGTGSNIGAFISYDDRTSINANLNDAINLFITAGSSITAISTFASAASYKDTFPPNAYVVLSILLDAANATASERFGFAVNGDAILKANTSTGTPTTSNASFALQYGAIGNNSGSFTGDFCEVLMYEKLLSDAERQKIEGYLAWKWGLQAQLPYDHPYARSFPGFGSQTVPTDADTLTYLAAVKAADGTGVEVGVANAVDDFVTGCKSDGIWDAMDQCCILAGARTLAGALVPLRGSAPTNNNFVSGDYDRETGLKGDGTNKNLVTAKATDQFSIDSFHASVYLHSITTLGGYAIGGTQMLLLNQAANVLSRALIANNLAFGSAATTPTFMGLGRTTNVRSLRVNGSNVSSSVSGDSSGPGGIRVFSTVTDTLFFDARMSFYSYGTLVDLAGLDTRVSALITAIGAAI